MPTDRKIRRALLSVTDKTGLADFARGLLAYDVELLSTGGTAQALRDAGCPVTDISEYTGFPEMLGGRVKTLHPKVHGGILGIRGNPEHAVAMSQHGILPIDLVCVNLYRFEETVSRDGVTRAEAVESIDIGGPSMIRSAAKNHEDVAVVTDPQSYPAVLEEMKAEGGGLRLSTRQRLAAEAFALTARYDAAITGYLSAREEDPGFPEALALRFRKLDELRYGENPHQKAAFYRESVPVTPSIAFAERLGEGKELSYNNILDLDAALRCVNEFDAPTIVIVKHNNPCGVASARTLREAYERALEADPVSAFGSIVASNRAIDLATAESMAAPGRFIEAIVAPEYAEPALQHLLKKPAWGKSLRALRAGTLGNTTISRRPGALREYRSVMGGLLVQTPDLSLMEGVEAEAVVGTPTEAQTSDLLFAWKVCKHVKSNAIVLVKDGQTVGIGAGQMSRLDSVKIALEKAGPKARGAVLASDAFFPFPDALEAAVAGGITAAIQPGGSKRDSEVFTSARKSGTVILLTGQRHFRH
ncbi:MAG: bifunctional phosphoribosylaminoimidazolecarboxamide formyltransferase/IMP cyclohydrolase [Planctomycetes bacterium]|nr:bifunctional phosphoribosylaminoimidazolecarboxamide formyltransferase/IMP cyclohydrolase [Planctomycetota bacterium]